MPQFIPPVSQGLDIQQPKVLGPMDAAAQVLGIRAQQQGIQMNALKIKEAQQEFADTQAVHAAAQQFGGDIDKMQEFLNRTNPSAATKFASAVAARKKTEAETYKQQLENAGRKYELVGQAAQTITDENSFPRGKAALAAILGPDTAEQLLGSTYNPAVVKQVADLSLKHKEFLDAQKDAAKTREEADRLALDKGKASSEARESYEKSIAQSYAAVDTPELQQAVTARLQQDIPPEFQGLLTLYASGDPMTVQQRANEFLGRKPPEPTADIQKYNFAVKQGYKGSLEQWLKEEANRRPVTEPTVVIRTQDAEGNPITQIVPKTAGQTFTAAPTAVEQNRRNQAAIIIREADRISDLIDKNPNAVGPILGRIARGETVIGNVPPEAKALGTALGSFVALQPILHGYRGGAQTVEHFTQTLGDQRLNAGALKASLGQIKILAQSIRQGKGEVESPAATTVPVKENPFRPKK